MSEKKLTDREQRLIEIAAFLAETMIQTAGVEGSGPLLLRRAVAALEEVEAIKNGTTGSALADAIVESLKSAPVVTDDGRTVCNCEACRNARN